MGQQYPGPRIGLGWRCWWVENMGQVCHSPSQTLSSCKHVCTYLRIFSLVRGNSGSLRCLILILTKKSFSLYSRRLDLITYPRLTPLFVSKSFLYAAFSTPLFVQAFCVLSQYNLLCTLPVHWSRWVGPEPLRVDVENVLHFFSVSSIRNEQRTFSKLKMLSQFWRSACYCAFTLIVS